MSKRDADKIKRAIAFLQSRGYVVLPSAGEVPFDDRPIEVRTGEWPPMADGDWRLFCERAAVLAEGARRDG